LDHGSILPLERSDAAGIGLKRKAGISNLGKISMWRVGVLFSRSVRAAWPIPDEVPKDINVVFVLVEHAGPEAFPWTARSDGPIVIGLVDYESPTTLKALLDWKAHGVVNKPIRPFGIMSSLVLARALGSYHGRLEAKINKLEETLRARRDVEKAIRILMELKNIEESDAYRLLRDQAQAKRLSIGQIAASIVSLHDTLGGLGLEVRGPAG
jgi:AmiR/NasT family two-component response regulator